MKYAIVGVIVLIYLYYVNKAIWEYIEEDKYLSAIVYGIINAFCFSYGYFLADTRFNFSAAFTKTIELFICLGFYILFAVGGIFAIWLIITLLFGRSSSSTSSDNEWDGIPKNGGPTPEEMMERSVQEAYTRAYNDALCCYMENGTVYNRKRSPVYSVGEDAECLSCTGTSFTYRDHNGKIHTFILDPETLRYDLAN